MKELTIGGLKVRMTGGSDRDGGGDGPLVILLHGFGAPGDDLVGLQRAIEAPEGTRFIFPEAPIALGREYGPGRAWWLIDMMRLEVGLMTGDVSVLTGPVPEGAVEARQKVCALLDAIGGTEVAAPASGKLFLGGFSQGAMLAMDVALRTKYALSGLIVLSGSLVAATEWLPLMPSRRGLPVVQSHGMEDPLLPFSLAEALRDAMTEAGLAVKWIPFHGGHGVPPAAMAAVGELLRSAS
jgi:phospholipase/carboxylesterase